MMSSCFKAKPFELHYLLLIMLTIHNDLSFGYEMFIGSQIHAIAIIISTVIYFCIVCDEIGLSIQGFSSSTSKIPPSVFK